MRAWFHCFGRVCFGRIFFSIILFIFTLAVRANTPSVDLVYPVANDMSQTLNLTGSVKSAHDAQIPALEEGVIAEIFVEAGDSVKQGDQLMRLDDTIAKTKLKQFKAALLSADIAHQEAERLYQEVIALSKQQVVAQTLLAERKAQQAIAYAQKVRAEAMLEEQQVILARHTLTAPFSGVITERFVDIGEWVSNQTRVISLVSEQTLRLELAIPQDYYIYFKQHHDVEGSNMQVRVIPGIKEIAPFSATISKVIGAANETSRTFEVFIDLDANKGVIAGMSANAILSFATQSNAQIVLPKSALKHHPDGGFSVFSIENNQAKRHIITVVETAGERVSITGVPADIAYVISGVELLTDGQTVVVNSIKGLDE